MAETLGDRIRARRQRRGLTLKDLAEKTKLSVPYLSDIERLNETNPTLESLELVAGALETSLKELLGGQVGAGEVSRPLPISLQRYVRGDEFSKRLLALADKAGRKPDEMKQEVIDFLVAAPKRAGGDLSIEDWRRLLVFYTAILEE